MILSDIWAECGRLLNDPNNTRWTTDVLTKRANLAQVEIQGRTNAVKSTVNVNLVANATGYSITTNTLDVLAAYITDLNGNVNVLKGISLEELNFRYPNWNQWGSGTPSFYYFDGTNSIIHLLPFADYSLINGLNITVCVRPDDMVSSTDTPFNSTTTMIPYNMSIVHWVVAQCWMDDGTPEALAKAKFHRSGSMLAPGEYEKQLGRIMEKFDSPEDVPSQILWQPEGGRRGLWYFPNKGDPFGGFF